jgi:AraC-like DNA-binding protein
VAHLYPPGTPYWEDASGVRGPVQEAWALFVGGGEAGLDRLIGRDRSFARIVDPAGSLDVCLREMALAGQGLGEAGFWRAQASLAAVIDLLRSVVRQADGTFLLAEADLPSGAARTLLQETQDYFRAHLGEKVTLAGAARHLGMSPSAFSHRYTEQAGQPPMTALSALRVEAAKSLLLRGFKMAAIAHQLGFFDAFHFSKTFKKHCGVTPSQFRRRVLRTAGQRRPI